MEFDLAVLGGGPAGYTAAIRAAQLGARVACVEQRGRARGDVPARRLHPDEGVGLDRARAPRRARHQPEARRRHRRAGARLRSRERVEGRRRQADDRWRRLALQGEQRDVVPGQRPLRGRAFFRIRQGRDRPELQERDRRDRLGSDHAAYPGARLAAVRRLDRAARADRGAEAPRRARRRDHRLRVRVDLRALRHRGDDDRDARHADSAGGCGRDERAPQVVRASRDRRPPRQAVHEGRGHREPR